MSGSRPAARGYHHGNLREELIRTAIEMVGARGVDGLSVAEAARQANVSPGAPYRHFADRDALLAAASLAATEALAAAYEEALASSSEAESRLAAVAAAHVRLSATTGVGFEIVYASGLDKSRYPELAAGARDLISLLLPPALELAPDHAAALKLLAALIALAHGYAGLLRSGFFTRVPDSGEELAHTTYTAARTLLAGYRARDARQGPI